MRTIIFAAVLTAAAALPTIASAQGHTEEGAATGAVTGGLVAGPPGAIVGGILGATVGAGDDAAERNRERVYVEPGAPTVVEHAPTVVERDAPAVRERTCVEEANGRQSCTETTR
jgi:hypothetical protein